MSSLGEAFGRRADPVVASAALCRAVLLARAAFMLMTGAAGLLLVADRWRVVAVLAVTVATTATELSVLSRWPAIVRRRAAVVAADTVPVLAVLALSKAGMAYFCCAAGAAALAGVLLGMRALPVWAGHAALGYLVAAQVLRVHRPPADISAFVMALPMTAVLAGAGGVVATSALARYLALTVTTVASAQRSAAASERARLARELHDSVTKTLRGVSFAALALPSSLRRHPSLAEQLAATVSRGADAAAQEARLLLEGLRVDRPDRPFAETVGHLCRSWSQASGIPVEVTVRCADPAVEVRYEVARVLQEALANVGRHARARRVGVRLLQHGQRAELVVGDDGVGYRGPADAAALQARGHFGIVGMFERAGTVGGSLRIGGGPRGGTELVLSFPLRGGTGPDPAEPDT